MPDNSKIHYKLAGIPTIYYFNLDNRLDRREYMESQFQRWGISNFKRISQSKYLASEADMWKNMFDGDIYAFGASPHINANSLTHLEFFQNWLNFTNDELLIIMEDDVDMNLIEYWHFDWTYLMNNIPYDWDCIQLGFESSTVMQFFLHPKPAHGTYFGPCLLNRRYVKKLVDLHVKNNKFVLKQNTANWIMKQEGGNITLDYFVTENGRVYCIPLFTVNNDLGSYESNIPIKYDHHIASSILCYEFWKNGRDLFSLEDFFAYAKPNDAQMTQDVPSLIEKLSNQDSPSQE